MNLRHKVHFYINTNIIDRDPWELYYSAFADIVALHPQSIGTVENFNFGHIITNSFFIITIRKFKEIKASMRIKFEGTFFEIKKINESFDNRKFLKLIVLEI